MQGYGVTAGGRHGSSDHSGGLRRGIVWGVVLGVIGASLWFFFLRGDESPRRIEIPGPGEFSSAPAAPKASAAGGKQEQAPIETFKVFAPKDPFDPLVEQSSSSGSANSGAQATGTGSTTVGSHTVQLIQVIDADTAQIQVDNTLYKINVDQAFAETFKLVSINGRCVSTLYGDEELRLCESR